MPATELESPSIGETTQEATSTEASEDPSCLLTGEKTTQCYVCGPDNPLGLHVTYYPDGPRAAMAIYIARVEHTGWTGILHGSILFALMDEAFGWSLFFEDIAAVTAKIETRFHKPVAIGTALHVRAWITGQRRRLYDAHAEIRIDSPDGTLVAEAEAVLYRQSSTLPE